MQLKVFQTGEELNRFAAERFLEIGNNAVELRGRFSVALAGGSTPKALYRLLADGDFKDKIDWNAVFFFFGDERNVPPDDAESNFRMADENLFQPLEIHPDKIFRWKTGLDAPEKIAEDYRKSLGSFFRGLPKFDLILLGMGGDGHTASLFPFTAALEETEKTAVENRVEKLNAWRFTLTFPLINNAENVMFLVTGEDKAETLKEVLKGEFQPARLPSQNVEPTGGNLFWLVDEAAARFLDRKNRRAGSLPNTA